MFKRLVKQLFKMVFPFKKPLSKRILDSWYKTLDDASRAVFIAALPYFWLTNASLGVRLRDTVLFLLVGYICHLAAFWLDQYQERLSQPPVSGENP